MRGCVDRVCYHDQWHVGPSVRLGQERSNVPVQVSAGGTGM